MSGFSRTICRTLFGYVGMTEIGYYRGLLRYQMTDIRAQPGTVFVRSGNNIISLLKAGLEPEESPTMNKGSYSYLISHIMNESLLEVVLQCYSNPHRISIKYATTNFIKKLFKSIKNIPHMYRTFNNNLASSESKNLYKIVAEKDFCSIFDVREILYGATYTANYKLFIEILRCYPDTLTHDLMSYIASHGNKLFRDTARRIWKKPLTYSMRKQLEYHGDIGNYDDI